MEMVGTLRGMQDKVVLVARFNQMNKIVKECPETLKGTPRRLFLWDDPYNYKCRLYHMVLLRFVGSGE